MVHKLPLISLMIPAFWLAPTSVSYAQTADARSFYENRTIEMIVGYPPGGSNDLFARMVANRIGSHIPGAPRVVVRNMPGAGSLAAANHLFVSAPQDGSVLGAVSQGIPLQARLGHPQARYNPMEFGWIGRVAPSGNVTMVWHTSKIMKFQDTLSQQVNLGATGAGSTVALYPSVMNEILKTRFNLIMGYKGSPDAMLAMERGEVEGHSTSWDVVKAVRPQWVKEGKIRILVQHALKRHPELPDVPTSVELTQSPRDRAVMEVIMSASEIGKSYFTTPNVPRVRLEALRRAFDQMVKDPLFLNDLTKIGGELGPLSGEEVQELIGDLAKVPADVIERVKAVYKEQ